MVKKKGKTSKGTKKEKKTEKAEKLIAREPSLWHPLGMARRLDDEFEELRRNIESPFWLSRRWRSPHLMRFPEFHWPEIDWTETRMPLVDIKDTGKELVLEAEMPGIPKENIDIKVTEDSIEICGEVKTVEKEEEEGYYRHERSYSRCFRKMPLPTEVIPDKADATLKGGILHIKIPKKKPTSKEEGHTIKIK